MTNYRAILVNKSGCVFAKTTDTNIKRIRSWAVGRGDDYTLEIFHDDGYGINELKGVYRCKGNKSYLVS